MENYRIKSGIAHIRFRAWPCLNCGLQPDVFTQFNLEFNINCCGYFVENKNVAVALKLWNDLVKEKTAEIEEKTLNGIISQCPICGNELKESLWL